MPKVRIFIMLTHPSVPSLSNQGESRDGDQDGANRAVLTGVETILDE